MTHKKVYTTYHHKETLPFEILLMIGKGKVIPSQAPFGPDGG